jgi:hypothetical protein
MSDHKQPTPIDESHYKIYDVIWKNMDRENQLINHRITWAIVFSGGIIAACAFLVSASANVSGPLSLIIRGLLFLLMACLSAVGVFFSKRTQEGVSAAQSQLDYLLAQYRPRAKLFEQTYGLPRPYGDRHDHRRGNSAASAFPVLMYWTWLVCSIVTFAISVWMFALGVDRSGLIAAARHESRAVRTAPSTTIPPSQTTVPATRE